MTLPGKVLGVECKLLKVSKRPFFSVGHCLAFYNTHNPARLKAINLLEPDGHSTTIYEDFSGQTEADLFAQIVFGVREVLNTCTSIERRAFALRHFGDRETQLAVKDIAKALHMTEKRLYQLLARIRDDLENEFSLRGLIEPPDDKD